MRQSELINGICARELLLINSTLWSYEVYTITYHKTKATDETVLISVTSPQLPRFDHDSSVLCI